MGLLIDVGLTDTRRTVKDYNCAKFRVRLLNLHNDCTPNLDTTDSIDKIVVRLESALYSG